MPEVLTQVEPDDSIERLSGLHHPCRDCDRERLEREVIERAKEFTDDKVPRENWDALVAYRELCRAVDALINFESSQQQIKK